MLIDLSRNAWASIMTWRRSCLIGLAVVVALVALVPLTHRLREPKVSLIWQAYLQIENGMAQRKVCDLLGDPDECTTGGLFGSCGVEPLANFGATRKMVWFRDEASIMIGFDDAGQVRCKDSNWHMVEPVSVSDEIRYFVSRAWRAICR